jgi:hypothetical protein
MSETIIELWRQTRTTIDHMDDKMNDIRLSVFTLFGTLSSVAAALIYWAPNRFLSCVRLSALVEIALIFALIPLIILNRLYHNWLFKAIRIAMNLEDSLHQSMSTQLKKQDTLITYGLTGLSGPPTGYWKTMGLSTLFWTEIVTFAFPLFAAIVLTAAFQVG